MQKISDMDIDDKVERKARSGCAGEDTGVHVAGFIHGNLINVTRLDNFTYSSVIYDKCPWYTAISNIACDTNIIKIYVNCVLHL